MIGQTLRLKVAALTDIAPSLRHVRLVAADGGKLPPAAAGAHIQLVLAGPVRSFRNAYSLVSRPGARDAWDIIVRRVPPPAAARPTSTKRCRPATRSRPAGRATCSPRCAPPGAIW